MAAAWKTPVTDLADSCDLASHLAVDLGLPFILQEKRMGKYLFMVYHPQSVGKCDTINNQNTDKKRWDKLAYSI